MLKYLTDEQVVDAFGDPAKFIRPDGLISATWEIVTLDSFELLHPIPLDDPDSLVKVTKIRCHRRIVPFMRAVFLEIQSDPDLRALIKSYSGCYSWRKQRGAKKRSRHAWAIAIDLNDDDNQMGDATPGMDPRIIDVFRLHGFMWGGNFGRPDGMHFEFAEYERLA